MGKIMEKVRARRIVMRAHKRALDAVERTQGAESPARVNMQPRSMWQKVRDTLGRWGLL